MSKNANLDNFFRLTSTFFRMSAAECFSNSVLLNRYDACSRAPTAPTTTTQCVLSSPLPKPEPGHHDPHLFCPDF